MNIDRNPAGQLRVFVVEDSPLIRRRLEEMVAECRALLAGHAASVGAAVRDIPAASPDIVILDLQLADGSGFEVLRALEGKAPGVEFFLFTNFAADPYRYVASQLGARGFFDKSKEFGQLREVVARRAATRH